MTVPYNLFLPRHILQVALNKSIIDKENGGFKGKEYSAENLIRPC